MTIQQYTESLNQRFKLENATEHRLRGDLLQLPATLSESSRLMLEIDKVDFS